MKIKLGLGILDMNRVAEYCGGEIYDFTGKIGSSFEYVCTDSREADEKTMFIATRGERVDGHDYITSAIESGCRCILCEYVPNEIKGKNVCFVVVENSIDAFANAARGYRKNTPVKTIAVTGSVGKTTTKELTSLIMRQKYETYSTVGNFNSVIGMPMSLMEAEEDKEAAVFEMGMSGFGEISAMSNCATPDVAMVTNIGSSHLEYLKTRENIAKAKLEIADGLREGGYLLLMGDEPILRGSVVNKYKNKCKILYVGRDEANGNDILIKNIRILSDKTLFDLDFQGKTYLDIEISAIGAHFAINAAFAATASLLMGCDEENVRAGLKSYAAGGIRQNISVRDGITVIADCYNAAPESMRASLDVLGGLSVSGKRVAVLGDMRELGKMSASLHFEVGKYAAERGVDLLFTLGELGSEIAVGAISSGLDRSDAVLEKNIDNIDEFACKIKSMIESGDAVLFKASRALALERIIEKIFD